MLSILNIKTGKNTMQKVFIGIDGCKVGWAVVEINNNSVSQPWQFYIIPKIENLLDRCSFPHIEPGAYNKSLINPRQKIRICKILIDIPIGLKESGPLERKCDKDARKFLGPKRGCSVFRVPARKTAQYDGGYREASNTNFELTGKKISKQTYNICCKIREVDDFIEKTKPVFDITGIMHESHPEVVFKSLAGTSLLYSKKTKKGFNERLDIVKICNNSIESFLDDIYKKFRKYEVQPDDILDAAVLAVAAQNIHINGRINRLPQEPEFDEKGIKMEIVYF